jgi:iron only hydrogenase large subunit-like protein
MNNISPIYTEKTECQDCYKCVRECPVKAIKIQNGAAAIIPELCILCGHCVDVCPARAKKVRNDLDKVQNLVASGKKTYVSLAPAFVSEFSNFKPAQLIHALKTLGFAGVSETALGAQQVSAHVAHQLTLQNGKIIISSACPTIVDLITKYLPQFTSSITGFLSPMLSHCKILKKKYGNDIGIVFIGPCIAKKREADGHPNLIDAALTFSDLRLWLEKKGIDPATLEPDITDTFIPAAAEEGALYPIDGGMAATLKANCSVLDSCFMTFSGLKNITNAFEDLQGLQPEGNIFIEALACEGGCINGPQTTKRSATALKRYSIVNYSSYPRKKIPRTPNIPINEFIADAAVIQRKFTADEIRNALRLVGKHSSKDELNCGGCGYDSCQDFASALLSGKAEKNMCVTYMRKLAYNKARGLLLTMPSGVIIIDEHLKIIESNLNFAKLFGPDIELIFQTNPGLEGATLEKIVPFHTLFRHVLDTGEDIIQRDIHIDKRILYGSIFTIEPHTVIGGIFTDITAPSMQKEQIISRSQEIINKNLSMVQKIAYLLGENASESETVLNSIIESFSSKDSDNFIK